MDFSFIHVSDIHLGRPFSDLSKYSYDENVKQVYKTAVEKTFKKIIDFAILKNVDFVLIAGDTFDSGEQDFASKLILKEGLKKLQSMDINVFLICGNHDPVSSYNKNTFNYDENSSIKIIGLNTPAYADLPLFNKRNEKIGIVHALSFKEEKFNENPVKYFSTVKEEEKNLFNIGLLHCDLNADSSSPYAPCSVTDLKNLNYNYWALGHIHIPSTNEDIIQYTGTVQGRNTKETGRHGIRYVKVENNNIIKNNFVPMEVVRFEDIDCELSSADDAVSALNLIEEHITKLQGDCEIHLIRLNLKGSINFFSEINDEFYNVLTEKIKTDFSNRVYISRITNSLLAKVDDDVLKEDDGITGEIYKTINDDEVIHNAYCLVEDAIKNFMLNCDFMDEEYNSFVRDVKQQVKEECLNLCSVIYKSEDKEE